MGRGAQTRRRPQNRAVVLHHAALVHEGYQIERNDGTVTDVPARRFIDTAIEDYNPIEAYSEILKGKLNE